MGFDNIPEKASFQGIPQKLWTTFVSNIEGEGNGLSNSIDLWDLVPIHSVQKREQNNLRENGILPTHEFTFFHQKKKYKVSIIPARLKIKGSEVEFYPADREQIVEFALRKIATEDDQFFFNGDRSGVRFTLHNLRKELKKSGHTLSYSEVIEALLIMRRANIVVSDIDRKVIWESSILSDLIMVNKDDIKEDPKARWYADFSVLVTEGIRLLKYRQFNNIRLMSYKSQLSRWLNTRMILNYTQASLLDPYEIKLTTVERDSKLLTAARVKDKQKKFERALEELKAGNVIINYTPDVRRGSKGRLLDIKYTILPHHDFISEQKAASKRLTDQKKNQSK